MHKIYQMRMPTKRTLSVCHDNNAFGFCLPRNKILKTNVNLSSNCVLEKNLKVSRVLVRFANPLAYVIEVTSVINLGGLRAQDLREFVYD